MKPIISPWWAYTIDMLGGLKSVSILFAVVIGTLLTFMVIFALIDENMENEPSAQTKHIKHMLITMVCLILIGVIIPSQKTMYTMMVLDNLTPNNIISVQGTIEDTIDYLTDKVEEIVDKER